MAQLARVQRQAAILITGAMRTTAGDVLDVHAGLLPLHLLVNTVCQRAATRLCTLPKAHPLYPHIRRAARYVKHHRSPLHELLHAFQLRPGDIETITPTNMPPGWSCKHKTEIEGSKERAEEKDKTWRRRTQTYVYTDGSDYRDGVGAAAVLIRSA